MISSYSTLTAFCVSRLGNAPRRGVDRTEERPVSRVDFGCTLTTPTKRESAWLRSQLAIAQFTVAGARTFTNPFQTYAHAHTLYKRIRTYSGTRIHTPFPKHIHAPFPNIYKRARARTFTHPLLAAIDALSSHVTHLMCLCLMRTRAW